MSAWATAWNLTSPGWEAWAASAIGLLSGGLTLLLGRTMLRRRRRSLPRPPEKPPDPLVDPFTYGSPIEHRQASRRRGRAIKVSLADAETRQAILEGWVVDRSMSGLRLAVQERVSEGSRWLVRPVEAPAETPWLLVEVRRCALVENRWEIGCMFEHTPPWGVLMLFG